MSRADRWIALAAAIGAAILYVATARAAGHGDVWIFVDALYSGSAISNQPLYLPTCWPLHAIGLSAPAALLWHARLCAALAVGCAVIAARGMGAARCESLLLAAAIAVTPVVWFFATCAEVHALQLLGAMLAVLAALRARAARDRRASCAWFLCASMLAVLSHPANALGLPALWLLAFPRGRLRWTAILGAWALAIAYLVASLTMAKEIAPLLPRVGEGEGMLGAVGGWARASFESARGIGPLDLFEHCWLEWIRPQACWPLALCALAIAAAAAGSREPARWALALAAPFLVFPALLRVREFGGYFAFPLAFALLVVARSLASAASPKARAWRCGLLVVLFAVQAACGAIAIARFEQLGSELALRERAFASVAGDERPAVLLTCTQPRTNIFAPHVRIASIDLRWVLDHAARAEREERIEGIAFTVEGLLGNGVRVLCDGALDLDAPTLENVGPLAVRLRRRFEFRELLTRSPRASDEPPLFELFPRALNEARGR